MDTELKVMLGAFVGVISVVVAVAWYSAGVEMRTYNRLTGEDVTQWEALFVELRMDRPCVAPGGAP